MKMPPCNDPLPASAPKERRVHRRFLCHTSILVASGGDIYHAWLDDFSIAGCRISSEGTLPIVGRIDLLISVIDGDLHRAEGMVVWSHDHTIGVKLLTTPPWLSAASVDQKTQD